MKNGNNKNNNKNKIIPKKDIVFKRLFGSVGSENILKDLLEAILEIKIKSLKLNLNKEIIPKYLKGKKNVLDVRAILDDGTQVNIEMQMEVPEKLEKRVLDYWSNLYASQLEKGKKYKTLNKTIAIWILDEDYFKKIPEYHTSWVIKETKNNYEKYFEDLELHFLELNKVRKGGILEPKKLDFWMWFIDHTNEEMVKMAYESEEQVEEALKKLRELQSDAALVDLMFRQDIYEMDQIDLREKAEREGLEKGLEKGLEQGLEQEKIETAKRMLRANIDIEIIMQATELSKEKIQEIQDEIKIDKNN